jgi:LysR family transcriptional regulator for metE and metH
MLLQMVACGRGVAALHRWLVKEFSEKCPVHAVRLGPRASRSKSFWGAENDLETDYLRAFMEMARGFKEHSENRRPAAKQ